MFHSISCDVLVENIARIANAVHRCVVLVHCAPTILKATNTIADSIATNRKYFMQVEKREIKARYLRHIFTNMKKKITKALYTAWEHQCSVKVGQPK